MTKGSKSSFTNNLTELRSHVLLVDRFKKSFYYGKTKDTLELDCPSLPLTEVTVDLFELALQKSPKKSLDVFDVEFAVSVGNAACVSPSSILLALIYIQRLKQTNPEYLRTITPCELFVVSLMVASKFLFDDGIDEEVFNDEWAASAQIELKDINRLEREFLGAIDWNIFVNSNEFYEQMYRLEATIALKEIKKRGPMTSLTYQELVVLSEFIQMTYISSLWLDLIEATMKVMVISSIAYSAIIASIITTTLLANQCQLHLSRHLSSTLLSSKMNDSTSASSATGTSSSSTTRTFTTLDFLEPFDTRNKLAFALHQSYGHELPSPPTPVLGSTNGLLAGSNFDGIDNDSPLSLELNCLTNDQIFSSSLSPIKGQLLPMYVRRFCQTQNDLKTLKMIGT